MKNWTKPPLWSAANKLIESYLVDVSYHAFKWAPFLLQNANKLLTLLFRFKRLVSWKNVFERQRNQWKAEQNALPVRYHSWTLVHRLDHSVEYSSCFTLQSSPVIFDLPLVRSTYKQIWGWCLQPVSNEFASIRGALKKRGAAWHCSLHWLSAIVEQIALCISATIVRQSFTGLSARVPLCQGAKHCSAQTGRHCVTLWVTVERLHWTVSTGFTG